MHLLFLTCLILFVSLSIQSKVHINTGDVEGLDHKGYKSFLGIPYIEPPVGERRFKPPTPKKPWEGVFQATKYGPGCPQHCELPPGTCPLTQSEDCIQLNVFVPSTNTSDPMPVLVYFPGGHMEQGTTGLGDSGRSLYDGQFLAKQGGFIVVTVNYRLGALGWMANVDMGLRGNLGLMDQREALKWVQTNIKSFGGDPDRVTISGQSAGATSVFGHMVSRESRGLFYAAYAMSNPIVIPFRKSELASAFGRRVAKHLNCTSLECLQNKPVDAILDAQYTADKFVNTSAPLVAFMELTVSIDGDDITENALDAFRKGGNSDVPFIFGSVSEEALIFIMKAMKKRVSTAKYVEFLTAIFYPRGAIAEVLYEYPPEPWFGDKRPALAYLGTDYIFACSLRYTAQNFLKQKSSNMWMYEFNQTLPAKIWGEDYAYCAGHVCHGSDVPYMFQALRTDPNVTVTTDQDHLMNNMLSYLTNFVHSGNPNKGPVSPPVEWATFDQKTKQVLEVQSPGLKMIKGLRKDRCDFWDHIGKPYPYHFGGED